MEFVISLGEWLQAHPQVSAMVYVIAFAGIMAVGIPGGNVLMLSGGLLYGMLAGALLATLGAMLAAATTHWLIRTAFGRWLDERAQRAGWSFREFVNGGNSLLLVMPRLIPLIPFFAINVGLTVAGVPLRTYLWTTLVGVIPVAALFASIGSELRGMQDLSETGVLSVLLSPGVALPLAALLALTLLGWFWVRDRRRGPA